MKWCCIICLCCLPLRHLSVNSGYGYRIHPVTGKYTMHSGVDLKAGNDTVFAIMNGVAFQTGYDRLLGLHIRLNHPGEVSSIYGHLSQVWVVPGDTVSMGQAIGITGSTGRVTGEHLHFAITCHKLYINPIKFLYELLINQQNEQKFQSITSSAFRKADY